METSTKPEFSIIIPTYNRADRIGCAIKSVIRQTVTSWELIVVDDGGNDATEQIVLGFEDPRIKYCWKENEERSIARNFGISLACGRYICLLDSDDVYLRNHLALAKYHFMKNREINVVHFGYAKINEVDKSREKFQYSSTFLQTELFSGNNKLSINAVAIRAEALNNVRFTNSKFAKIGEDWSFWLKLLSRNNLYSDRRITSLVVEHDFRSIASSNPFDFEKSMTAILNDISDDKMFLRKMGDRGFRKFYYFTHLRIGLKFLIDNPDNKGVSLNYFWSAVVGYPKLVFTRHFLIYLFKYIKLIRLV